MYSNDLAMILLILGVSTPVAIIGSVCIAFIRGSKARKNALIAWSYAPAILSFLAFAIWNFSIPVEHVPYQPVWLGMLIGAAAASLLFTPVWALAALFSHNLTRRRLEAVG
jgi:hypothetical protein